MALLKALASILAACFFNFCLFYIFYYYHAVWLGLLFVVPIFTIMLFAILYLFSNNFKKLNNNPENKHDTYYS